MVGGWYRQQAKSFLNFMLQLLHSHTTRKKISKLAFVYKNAKIIILRPSPIYPYFTDTKRKQSKHQQTQKFAIYYSFTSLQWQQTIYQFTQNNGIIVLKSQSINFSACGAEFAFYNGITVVLWR